MSVFFPTFLQGYISLKQYNNNQMITKLNSAILIVFFLPPIEYGLRKENLDKKTVILEV